ARRQIDCLGRLAARAASADSPASACRTAVAVLEGQNRDAPFGLVYLLDSKDTQATLTGAFGLKQLPPAAPPSCRLGSGSDPFCLAAVVSAREPVLIEGVEQLVKPFLLGERLVPRQALA